MEDFHKEFQEETAINDKGFCMRNLPGGHMTIDAEQLKNDRILNMGIRTFLEYDYSISDKGVTIINYRGNEKYVCIPSSIDGHIVTALGMNMFFGNDCIEEIDIPEGVQKIGNGCFAGCSRLRTVHLPRTLKSIGDDSGYRTITKEERLQKLMSEFNIPREELESLDIKEEVIWEGNGAFAGSGIERIAIPDSVIFLQRATFVHCKSLVSVFLGDGITEIKEATFSGCLNLHNVALPRYLKKIGEYAFSDCIRLVTLFCYDGLIEICDHAFEGAIMRDLFCPSSVQKIGNDIYDPYLNSYRSIHCPEKAFYVMGYAASQGITWDDNYWFEER